MEGDAAQHLVPAAVPQRDIAQSYHAAGLLTEQSGLYMRKLEERINRSGLWRPDVPHFIDKDVEHCCAGPAAGECSSRDCDRLRSMGRRLRSGVRARSARHRAAGCGSARQARGWRKEGGMAGILLAEDDAATRDLVERALSMDGHKIIVTQDGAEALEKLQSAQAVDLLISDVQMPGIDGIELVEKGLAARPKLRVILMSGFSDELGRADHLEGRIARVISKPFTLEQIRAAVRSVLG
jgi:CheY-like chemotaxis protein